MGESSSVSRLAGAVRRDRARIEAGERPCYRATWSLAPDGAADVRVQELPIIHVFVPDSSQVAIGARLLIARTLAVDPTAFDVEVAPGADLTRVTS